MIHGTYIGMEHMNGGTIVNTASMGGTSDQCFCFSIGYVPGATEGEDIALPLF